MTAAPDRVEAAWRMLADLGVTITDLHHRRPMPTIAEYLPQVAAAAGPGARRTYGAYWNRMTVLWGQRRLDEVTATDIEALRFEAAGSARSRRNSRSGLMSSSPAIATTGSIRPRTVGKPILPAGS
jgi:hypothetical protein